MCIRDRITTDHISPAGSFKPTTPAGKYLTERQVAPKDFNSYGSVSYTHLRAHETVLDLVCRLLLEKKKKTQADSDHDSSTLTTN